jgi:hypothetical protein
MGTVVSQPLSDAEQVFKSLIWDPMIKAGEIWFEGAVPFLDLPVIKQIDEFALQELTDALFNQLVIFVDVTDIRLMNPVLQSKWSSASEALTLIGKEQGVGSDAYKQALSTAATDFANWVHTGPT